MKRLLAALLLFVAALPSVGADAPALNTLTPKEIAEGWILLFDGATTFGWKSEGEAGVSDGALVVGGAQASRAVTTTAFPAFRFAFEVSWEDAKEWQPISGTAKQAECELEGKIKDPERLKSLLEGTKAPGRFSLTALPGKAVRVRNLKLLPSGLEPIFNGKDLSNWKEVKTDRTKSVFGVTSEGWLNVRNGPGDLQSEGQWDDFVLQLDCISNGNHLNSGVFFRCLPGEFWSGYEAQVRNQWQGDDRTKPFDYGTGGIYNRQPARKVVSTDREWFTMTVAAQGNHLAVWVNGYQTADYTDMRPPARSARNGTKTDKGPISLQGHDPTTDLSFRNIRIAELPKSAK
jgi:hypothetical protein